MGTLLTLLFTPTSSLFRPVLGTGEHPTCVGAQAIGMFCLGDRGSLPFLQIAAIVILAWVISGYFPRWSALPHWWVSFSVNTGISIPDGGDQLASILTLVLIPILLLDGRRNHWLAARDPRSRAAGYLGAAVAAPVFIALKVQMSLLYFQAAVAKLGVEEWQDGTYLWYVAHGMFGASGPVSLAFTPIVSNWLGVALLTWGSIALEMVLALAWVIAPRYRPAILVMGLSFHLAISFVLGLWSFMFSMGAGLIVLVTPLSASGYRPGFRFSRPHEVLRIQRWLLPPTAKASRVATTSSPASAA